MCCWFDECKTAVNAKIYVRDFANVTVPVNARTVIPHPVFSFVQHGTVLVITDVIWLSRTPVYTVVK